MPNAQPKHFADRLIQAVRATGNSVLVGIDPRPNNLPRGFLDRFATDTDGIASALATFSRDIIDVVAARVPAVKFQAAFFEQFGPPGMAALRDACEFAAERGLIVILDGKRNDIGSTAEAYADGYLGATTVGSRRLATWRVDALTVNPYLGRDGIDPFVKVASREGKGVFALVRTSNPSARDFQDLVADGRPVYRHVAERVVEWAEPRRGSSGYSLLGAVVGATYPDELAILRGAMPGILFLVPGYGSQGGTGRDVAAAFDTDGLGAIVNNSRGICFAYERADLRERAAANWQAAVEIALDEMIADLAENTPMGRLKAPAAPRA